MVRWAARGLDRRKIIRWAKAGPALLLCDKYLMLRALTFSLIAGITALSSCDCDGELEDVPGSMVGQACRETGEPLPSAVVHIAGPSETEVATDAEGRFTAKNLRPGTYDVTVDIDGDIHTVASGVVVDSQIAALANDPACANQPIVPSTGSVEGNICNRHVGSLVAGGTVMVSVGSVVVEGVTDDNGHFLIEGIPEGEGTVTIIAPGFQRTFPVTITIGEVFHIELADDCNIQTSSTGCVTGSICDPAAGPDSDLVGGTVTVNPSGTVNEGTNELTDTEGFFEVCGLTPGSYEVRVQKGSVDATEVVTVVAGETTTIIGPSACALRLQLGRIEGQICDEAAGGVFVGQAELRTSTGVLIGTAVTTDADGTFRFENVDAGSFKVRLFNAGFDITIDPVVVQAFQTTRLTATNCPGPEPQCVQFLHQPDVSSDGRVFFIVDKSGSMGQVAAGFVNKMEALKDAIESVTTTLSGPDIDFALITYPDSNGRVEDACNAGTQKVTMGGTGQQINSILNPVTPAGGTPTAGTLANAQGTIAALALSDRPLAVVLLTDGAPNCATTDGLNIGQEELRQNCAIRFGAGSVCTSNIGNCVISGETCFTNNDCNSPGDRCDPQTDSSCAPFNCLDLTAVNRVRDVAALGVDVHVVGIRGNDESSPAFVGTLNDMAVAGGAPVPAPSATRFHDATSTQALNDSLAAITRRILACTITTPFDVQDAGVSVSVRLGTTPLLQNVGRTNGWDATGRNTITLFGVACDRATDSEDDITITRCTE